MNTNGKLLDFMAPAVGIEPTTNWLTALNCSFFVKSLEFIHYYIINNYLYGFQCPQLYAMLRSITLFCLAEC